MSRFRVNREPRPSDDWSDPDSTFDEAAESREIRRMMDRSERAIAAEKRGEA